MNPVRNLTDMTFLFKIAKNAITIPEVAHIHFNF